MDPEPLAVMMFKLESEAELHSDILKLALENWEGGEPDLAIIAEDGSKVFTSKIIISMYSKTFCDILTEFPSTELASISLPIPSSSPVTNLLKILTQGMVISTENKSLVQVRKAARYLDIRLDELLLGKRKIPHQSNEKEHGKISYKEKTDTKYKIKKVSEHNNDSIDTQNSIETSKLEHRKRTKRSSNKENAYYSKKKSVGDSIGKGNIVEEGNGIKEENGIEEGHLMEEENSLQEEDSIDEGSVVKEIVPADGNTKSEDAKGKTECNECGKVFARKDVLKKHMRRIHTGEKKLQRMDRTTVHFQEGIIDEENRSEEGNCIKEEEFMVEGNGILEGYYFEEENVVSEVKAQKDCSECGKMFARKDVLDHHMMIHTGERPFICDECDKGFITAFKMKQHKLTHSVTKPFACHCGAKFTIKDSLKRHEQIYHSD